MMGEHRVQIYCEGCTAWLPVESGDEWVECDCGARYALGASARASPMVEG